MNCRRMLKSVQALSAHSFLFCFTLVLVLKLDHTVSYSWWVVCLPLWAFHAVVSRGRFSLPAPIAPRNRHDKPSADRFWAPCHAIVATPLLVAFELLLCVYLESAHDAARWPPAVSLKIVFLPLLAFEVTILVDNARMCRALMPGDEESINDEAIWEALPHFWVAISMVFFLAATVFTLLKLSGDVAALGWWDLFINFGIAECFAFLVCTKWSNPVIHRGSRVREPGSSFTTTRYNVSNSGLLDFPEDDMHQDGTCGLQDIGGHIMKIPLILFQVVLCMHLEGTPEAAKYIPVPVLFSPLFLLQGVGILFAASKLVEKFVLLVRGDHGTGLYFRISSRAHDCLGFLHHGSRLLGWWSIDEGSQEEQARIYFDQESGYSTFCGHPPEIVKKMPKKDLAEECCSPLLRLIRCGDFKQHLVNKQKLQNSVSRNMRDFKMKKCCVGFVSKEKSVWYCFHADTVFSAETAQKSVKNVPSAV
ncbi:hypothetical protein Bca4012_057807 [Brassica carinata]